MRSPAFLARSGLAAAALALYFFVPACNADVETVCYGGDCNGVGGGSATTSTTSAGGSGGGGAAMCPSDPQSGDIPCDVHAILVAKCQTCHNADHLNGAPIDLLACERFHEIDCDNQMLRADKARDYVESGFMPIGPDLTAEEKQTLLDWLSACAPCETAGSACGDAPGDKACYAQ